jgi:hypothetical protein
MKALIAALATATLISAPLPASASHSGGGGHGAGGFQGGGAHPFGGLHGGGGHGFGHGGDFRRDSFRGGRGDFLLFDADFGFGWGFYDPWDYGYFPAYYPNDYTAAYDQAASPPAGPGPAAATGPASAGETSECGNWHWDSEAQKYRWVTEAC